jgi:hypothetical protein
MHVGTPHAYARAADPESWVTDVCLPCLRTLYVALWHPNPIINQRHLVTSDYIAVIIANSTPR